MSQPPTITRWIAWHPVYGYNFESISSYKYFAETSIAPEYLNEGACAVEIKITPIKKRTRNNMTKEEK